MSIKQRVKRLENILGYSQAELKYAIGWEEFVAELEGREPDYENVEPIPGLACHEDALRMLDVLDED